LIFFCLIFVFFFLSCKQRTSCDWVVWIRSAEWELSKVPILFPKLLSLENPFECIWNLKSSFEIWKFNWNHYPISNGFSSDRSFGNKIGTFDNSHSADLIQTTQSQLVLCLHDKKKKTKIKQKKIKQKSCFITYYSTNEMYVKVDKSQIPLLFPFVLFF
jgi:hypothetical protein